jgi:hypothetical protein
MKKNTLLGILNHMEKTGNLPGEGNGLCNVIKDNFGPVSVPMTLLSFFQPSTEDRLRLINSGKCPVYWASGSHESRSVFTCDKATPLRKTIVAFMAVMAGEI